MHPERAPSLITASMPVDFRCRICNGPLGPALTVREMMYGTRDEFDYHQCHDCACLQISEIPEDIEKYYPESYYSFRINPKRKHWLRDITRKIRNLYAIEGNKLLGAFLCALKAPAPIFEVYGRVGLNRRDSVLDVGGGGGGHVRVLRAIGFNEALAIDPFIEADVTLDGQLLAKKASIFDVTATYNLITFHHSLEHMDQQLAVLKKARSLLSKDGKILIRIPTVSSEAFDTYGANWSDLDAPRHFYLHSHKSISLLAESAGLQILDLWCDSASFQFWASEQYAADIPLIDPRSYSQNPEASPFNASQIAELEVKSRKLNNNLRGDSICVVLSATNGHGNDRDV